jgi:hypothetical protein
MKSLWRNAKSASLVLPALLLLTASSFAATYYVGTCHASSYATISAAVAAVPANSVIDICPGTYVEQVFITQPMTLQGIKSGQAERARIVPPLDIGGVIPWVTVPNPVAGELPIAPQIFVNVPSGVVKLSNLTTDASAATAREPLCSKATYITAGIAYLDSSGTITDDAALGEGETSGCTVGILAIAAASNTVSVTITNNALQNQNLAGIKLESSKGNAGVTANVASNSVVVGPGTLSSNIGISVFGVTGTVSSNVVGTALEGGIVYGISALAGNDVGPLSISNNTFYNALGSGMTGISVGSSTSTRTVNGNTMVGVNIGFVILGAGAMTMEGNEVLNSGLGIDFACGLPILNGNILNNVRTGIYDAPGGVAPAGVAFFNVDQRNGGGSCR